MQEHRLCADEGSRKPARPQQNIPSPVSNNDSHCCSILSVHLALFIFVHTDIIQMKETSLKVLESDRILYTFKTFSLQSPHIIKKG